MKIAIPMWNGSISNVFDFAGRLLLVDIKNDKEVGRSEALLQTGSLPERAGRLKELEVDVLVCGAISRALADMVIASGIQLLPYVTGQVDKIVHAYLTDQLARPQFTMPGCWPGARKDFGHGQHVYRWKIKHGK